MEKSTPRRLKAWPTYLTAAKGGKAIDRIKERAEADGNDCWIWQGTVNERGYGTLSFGGTTLFAHRLSYVAFRGEFDPSFDVDHLCRVTKCVNPEHLEPVTHLENMRRGSIAQAATCKRGHTFGEERDAQGKRMCATCRSDYERPSRPRKSRAKVGPRYCNKGHDLSEARYVSPKGESRCRVCNNAQNAERNRLRRAALRLGVNA